MKKLMLGAALVLSTGIFLSAVKAVMIQIIIILPVV